MTLREKIMADPAMSDWLKSAIRELDCRDVLDALNDAALLHRVMLQRYSTAGLTPTDDTADADREYDRLERQYGNGIISFAEFNRECVRLFGVRFDEM